MEFAFEYLKNELEQLNNELKETEKKIELLERTLDFSSELLDPRYKRLTDKYDNLNAHACSIRMKMAEYLASYAGECLKLPSSSSNASVPSSSASASASAGAKRKSSSLSSNNSTVTNNLSSNGMHQDVISLNHMITSSPGDQIAAVIDRSPNYASNASSSFAMQVDNQSRESSLLGSSFPKSSDLLPSFSTVNTNNNTNNLNSANNAINSGWSSFEQTIFRNVTPVVHLQAASSTSFPMAVGAPLHHNNHRTSSPLAGFDGLNGNSSHQNNVLSSSFVSSTTTDPKSFVSAGDIMAAKSVPSFFNNHLLPTPLAAPRPTSELEASILQTDEYVEMKTLVAKIMKLFHEKKLRFVTLDGSPIYAQQYQAISLRVKQGEKITDFIRGQMLSYITGIDKKRQTISKTDLFLPDYQRLL